MGKRGGGTKMMVDSSLKNQPESSNPSLKRTRMSPEITAELTNLAARGNKMLEIAKTIPRRSQRIQNTASSSQDREAGEHEEGHQCSYKGKKASMEEKIDNLIILLEEKGKTIEALLSKGVDRCIVPQDPCATDIGSETKKDKYKHMYIESQKKINDLKDENYELRKNLETALGKLDGYENGQLVFSDAIEKLKDACVISSLTKTAEIVFGLSSSQAIAGGFAVPTAFPHANSPGAKRKRITKAKRKVATGSGKKE